MAALLNSPASLDVVEYVTSSGTLIFFSGAFGVVHRCVEKATGHSFVAKFINTPNPTDKMTVRNEINIMNKLHDPRLLNLHDAFEDRHEMIMIMELYVPCLIVIKWKW